MEKDLILSMVHLSEDIDINLIKIKENKNLSKIVECIKNAVTIEQFYVENAGTFKEDFPIEDLVSELKEIQKQKNIDIEKLNCCIQTNSFIYAGLVDLYEKPDN